MINNAELVILSQA